MTESAVAFLLDKLASLLHEEVHMLRGVRGELEDISVELERMQTFLRVADWVEDGSDPELNKWFRQLRDVACDAEDILDEFMLRVGHDHGDKLHGLLRKIISYQKNRKAHHRLASGVQAVRSRISNLSERYQNYGYISQNYSFRPSASTCFDRRGDALLVEESELVGIDKPKSQLIGWLLENDPRLKVVAVVGMGGVGKTTLVKKVYDDAQVKMHFDNHAWIYVSQSCKIEEILKDMIYQLFDGVNKQVPQGMETMNSHLLKTIVKRFLQQRRYMLVLDDIWATHAWDSIKHILPNNGHGSRVLLTTRNTQVAFTACIGSEDKIFTLEPLSEEESWILFCRKTFKVSSSPPHMASLAQLILRRCGGLPLAIVAISGVLATKDRSRIDEWEKLARNLGSEIQGNDNLKSMAKILLLSYNDLPYYLKSCFLYLSIFPDDYSIDRMRVIRLWIAEGFVKQVAGKTLEDEAEAYLNELLARSLIQVAGRTSDGRVRSCRVHSLVREIILSKSRDHSFTMVVREENVIWPEKVRRLSIHSSSANLQAIKRATKLRSLFVFGVSTDLLSKLSMPSRYELKLLTVLDMQGAPLDMVPNELFKLVQLKYLSFRDTTVKKLPNSIGNLHVLETLDLKRTGITELPLEILNLCHLRHLLVYRYERESLMPYHYLRGFKAPSSSVGGLRTLQKLSFIELNEDNSLLEELAKLHQLRRLGITNLRKEDGAILCSSIENLTNLRSLNIHSVEEDEIIDMQRLSSPPKFLQRLYLHGRLLEVPSWMSALHSLVKLYLRWSRVPGKLLEFLGDLPNLAELQLHQAYDGKELNFKAGYFQRLKILFLDELEELRSMRVEKGAMPLLEELTISRCQMLEEVPPGIKHLKNVRTIKFLDMPDELHKMASSSEEDGDYWKLSHVPQVYFIKWKNSCWERIILSVDRPPAKTGGK